ncbi:hypothetical protein QEK76_004387, partial [Stenotrophomonas maltophilia]
RRCCIDAIASEAGSVNQAHPACRQLGRTLVKTAIGLIRQDFCADTHDQNGITHLHIRQDRRGIKNEIGRTV